MTAAVTRAQGIAHRHAQRLERDPARVVAMLFVPGQEGFDQRESRSGAVLSRILALSDDEVQHGFDDVVSRFANRHRDLLATFGRHADQLADHLDPSQSMSETRRLLVGATFTSEYAVEGAALCNPSIVAHPDQAGLASGELRFVMSVRAIGEGHRSSIGFRTGVVGARGEVSIEEPGRYATAGDVTPTELDASVFRGELHRLRGRGENADFVLKGLGDRFPPSALEERLGRLDAQSATRKRTGTTATMIRRIAERSYGVSFTEEHLSARVLLPAMAAECKGMEDARFVRFSDDGGEIAYYATYTAYDGNEISLQLLETTDFRSFRSSPLVGPAAANKGLALFPRRIGGQFAALSRSDRETNTLAFSTDLHRWDAAVPCQSPESEWEVLQLGNCGSPIETEAGWLVLTHGVGPMRTYSIGAILLDLDDPARLIGRLREPLLTPGPDEQDGYVPNVVYSCGSLVHGDTLVLPYGIGDASIGMATVSVPALLEALHDTAH